MDNRGHNRYGPKRGGLLCPFRGNVTHPNKPYLPYWIYHNKVAVLVDKLMTYRIE